MKPSISPTCIAMGSGRKKNNPNKKLQQFFRSLVRKLVAGKNALLTYGLSPQQICKEIKKTLNEKARELKIQGFLPTTAFIL